MTVRHESVSMNANPFENPGLWRRKIIDLVKLTPRVSFNGRGFICALITSRCPVGCAHCMFGSNMSETRNHVNTMTSHRISRLIELVRDSNTGYLLVSGGGEGFLELDLMYKIVEQTTADITWMVTGAHWATNKEHASAVVQKMYGAFLKGKHRHRGRKVFLRVSLDSYHVEKIARPNQPPLQYVVNLVEIFERDHLHEPDFHLLIHALEGEEALVDEFRDAIHAKTYTNHDSLHDYVKVTESALTMKLESGYEFEVTFAKLLQSDLAADLRDNQMLAKRIGIFEKDAFQNERGLPALKFNADGSKGPNMLVMYDGRVAGGWQSEMPDVRINVDSDDFRSVMGKTLSDPGVLGTIENGLKYRFDIIQEICPKAVLRAKAVNVRDYTSPVLLEEDKLKLYYSIRVLQDYVAQSRVKDEEVGRWPDEIRSLVNLPRPKLQAMYRESRYDIVQQFIESDKINGFDEFVRCVKHYTRDRNPKTILGFFASHPQIGGRIVDKWRLLLARIAHDWYDICTFDEAEMGVIQHVERILDEDVLAGKRIYEGLSSPVTDQLPG